MSSREIHSTLCFNGRSAVKMSQRCWRTRKARNLEERRGAGCPCARTGVTELCRRRWHLPIWGEAVCSSSQTLLTRGLGLTLSLFCKTRHAKSYVSHIPVFNWNGLFKLRPQTYLDKQQRDTGKEKGPKTNWEKQRRFHGLI